MISEILLIRTKAKQVVPVFNEFIKNYPNLETFFDIKKENSEKLLKSLGLLFRSQFIVELKEQLHTKYKNKIPHNFKDLKSLKGIGNYGANAILCFGFGEKKSILDSNFIRVYRRISSIQSQKKTPKTDKFLWEFAEEMLPDENYIDFNYAVLDLGGTICISRNPKCELCPVKKVCDFFNKTRKC